MHGGSGAGGCQGGGGGGGGGAAGDGGSGARFDGRRSVDALLFRAHCKLCAKGLRADDIT